MARASGERLDTPRRQEIFSIATKLFYEKGYTQTSTKDIADAAGILKGSLYAHVDSKEDILLAVVEDIHTRFDANRKAVEALEVSPYDRLLAFLTGHLRVALSALEYHIIYSRDWRSLSAHRYQTIRDRRDAYQRDLAALLAAAQADGRIRTDLDAPLLAITVLTMLNSVHTWYKPGGAHAEETVSAAYLGVVLHGITTGDDGRSRS